MYHDTDKTHLRSSYYASVFYEPTSSQCPAYQIYGREFTEVILRFLALLLPTFKFLVKGAGLTLMENTKCQATILMTA